MFWHPLFAPSHPYLPLLCTTPVAPVFAPRPARGNASPVVYFAEQRLWLFAWQPPIQYFPFEVQEVIRLPFHGLVCLLIPFPFHLSMQQVASGRGSIPVHSC